MRRENVITLSQVASLDLTSAAIERPSTNQMRLSTPVTNQIRCCWISAANGQQAGNEQCEQWTHPDIKTA